MKTNHAQSGQTILLSGIPRSGTTLSCHLLNQAANTVALHEPINPSDYRVVSEPIELLSNVLDEIYQLRSNIVSGQTVNSGATQGLSVDNPVGEQYQEGLRRSRVERGTINIDKRIDEDFTLVVKQNAFFAALSSQLIAHLPMVFLVRNPVDVLLSWWTVDLPVNKGHIPAGERVDKSLASQLKSIGNVLDRQLAIYRWFCKKFTSSDATLIYYEDVIAQNGMPLFDAVGVQPPQLEEELSFKKRSYPEFAVRQLSENRDKITSLADTGMYTANAISSAIDAVCGE
ncbi:sulfotransferase domain-containing protein [Aestuariibacter salexigens]|uniref:sulfotransferase domain-containing protein n=1 Tax=Aestuariibacter salexigens TaxID=226010 RepID=UPI00041DCB3B|nr:sulfotransferase domain-containing protein [Aestuariibacter salexigens]